MTLHHFLRLSFQAPSQIQLPWACLKPCSPTTVAMIYQIAEVAAVLTVQYAMLSLLHSVRKCITPNCKETILWVFTTIVLWRSKFGSYSGSSPTVDCPEQVMAFWDFEVPVSPADIFPIN